MPRRRSRRFSVCFRCFFRAGLARLPVDSRGPDDVIWTLQIGPRELLAILFSGIGIYLIITGLAAVRRIGFLLFRVKAAEPVLAKEAGGRLCRIVSNETIGGRGGEASGGLLLRGNF